MVSERHEAHPRRATTGEASRSPPREGDHPHGVEGRFPRCSGCKHVPPYRTRDSVRKNSLPVTKVSNGPGQINGLLVGSWVPNASEVATR